MVFNSSLKILRAILERNRDSLWGFAVLLFNIEHFWWREGFAENTPENVKALLAFCDGIALEGATDLRGALAEAVSPRWSKTAGGDGPRDLFLLSDGAATWGERDSRALAALLKGAPPFV
mgnify:CR=1 FL=1